MCGSRRRGRTMPVRDDLLRRVERLEAGLREREGQLLELEEAVEAGGDVDVLLARFRSELSSGGGRGPRRRRFLRPSASERLSAPPVTRGSPEVPEAPAPPPRSTEGAEEAPVASPAEVEDPRYARRSPVDGTPINEGVTMVRASGRPRVVQVERLFD